MGSCVPQEIMCPQRGRSLSPAAVGTGPWSGTESAESGDGQSLELTKYEKNNFSLFQ